MGCRAHRGLGRSSSGQSGRKWREWGRYMVLSMYVCVFLSGKATLNLLAGQKMYAKQTVYDAHLTSRKHVKAAAKQAESGEPPANPNGPPTTSAAANGNGNTPRASSASKHRTAALLTHLTTKLLASLTPALNDTKSNVERRFSLTAREREQELIEQSKPKAPPAPTKGTSAETGEEEEEEERIYNPLKLPMGWDGKPIPYWLYKLHGLGVEYRCEICSDHVYMGRYAHILAFSS